MSCQELFSEKIAVRTTRGCHEPRSSDDLDLHDHEVTSGAATLHFDKVRDPRVYVANDRALGLAVTDEIATDAALLRDFTLPGSIRLKRELDSRARGKREELGGCGLGDLLGGLGGHLDFVIRWLAGVVKHFFRACVVFLRSSRIDCGQL